MLSKIKARKDEINKIFSSKRKLSLNDSYKEELKINAKIKLDDIPNISDFQIYFNKYYDSTIFI